MNGAVKQTKNMQLSVNTNTRRDGKEKVNCLTSGMHKLRSSSIVNFSGVSTSNCNRDGDRVSE